MPSRIAITGANGLIGRALGAHLDSLGHDVVRIVRTPAQPGDVAWDPARRELDPRALDGVDAVVHLAGAGIGDHRWTDDYKRELVESRTASTDLIATAIAAAADGPRVLLSGSAIGVYGDRGSEDLDETSAPGDGFLAELCLKWEAATAPALDAGARVVHLRTGVVLSADGGALAKQLPLFRFGLGGRMGSGQQWLSWIAIHDHVAAVTHLLDADTTGPVNVTAPNPVTNVEFTKALGAVLGRPTILRVPRFAPGLVLGRELADNLLFAGQKVHPRVLAADAGFEFADPEIEGALRAVLGR